MGTLLRSEEMQLVQLYVQIEAAHDTVDELGKLGLVEFKDLNPDVNPFQRNFVNEIRRCTELERKIEFLNSMIRAEKRLPPPDEGSQSAGSVELGVIEPKKFTMDDVESVVDDLEKELKQMNLNQDQLNRNHNELVELKYAAEVVEEGLLHEDVESKSLLTTDENQNGTTALETQNKTSAVKLGFVTGVIVREKFVSFQRVLWRALRGNLYMKHSEIDEKIKDPQTGELLTKNVFIVYYQGDKAQAKIKKICESFQAHVYPCSNDPKETKDLIEQVTQRLKDLEEVISRTNSHRRAVLADVARKIGNWQTGVLREKSIYEVMNRFNYDVGRKCLIAEGWIPKNSAQDVINAMRKATESSGALVPSILSVVSNTKEIPPTFFRTNKFTKSYQAIVDSYGIAHYREINPAVFATITFPFLFAVMFGDFGHGLLMTLFALVLLYKEKEWEKKQLFEMLQICFSGRYVLVMMGLFSMYTGLLYNEAFSVPIPLCGTNWQWIGDSKNAERIDNGRTYEFGVDPAWAGSANTLLFYNSLKMKMSIVFGVIHMLVGIFVSLLNALHFGHTVDVYAEFIPKTLFMLAIFGYLVLLMFYKWATNWTTSPPFLLNTMINMFLSIGTVKSEDQLYDGQAGVQVALVLLAVVCVPWMLCLKPYIIKRRMNKKLLKNPPSAVGSDSEHSSEEHSDAGHGGHDDATDFGEMFIQQTIHTIEFVLGAISNTASYLRLWALSLAHSELSLVFYERVLLLGFGMKTQPIGFIAVFICWAIWGGATIGVLMIMESLSSFLHALRLHWVEFQGKFYLGDGRGFKPFSYATLGQEEDI
mmetsp:Transcript_29218/g.41123  ORF Transcript_29218/g.41123 Transcript_29218/m.41123 type:complete len:818 (+) Transcript_29218:142-2595(+)